IAQARAGADGARITIEGVLTTSLGAFDGGRGAFVEDETGAIGLYLDSAVVGGLPPSTRVRLTGVLDERYSQRILRVALAEIADLGGDVLPAGLETPTGDATEAAEALRIIIE